MSEDNKLMEHRYADALQSQCHALALASQVLRIPGVELSDSMIINYNKGVEKLMENIANLESIRKLS